MSKPLNGLIEINVEDFIQEANEALSTILIEREALQIRFSRAHALTWNRSPLRKIRHFFRFPKSAPVNVENEEELIAWAKQQDSGMFSTIWTDHSDAGWRTEMMLSEVLYAAKHSKNLNIETMYVSSEVMSHIARIESRNVDWFHIWKRA